MYITLYNVHRRSFFKNFFNVLVLSAELEHGGTEALLSTP